MTNRQERLLTILMAINAIVFISIYAVVSSNNRLAADDFHYLITTQQLGVWDSMLFYYNNWNPRWSATLVTNSVLGNYSSPQNILIYQLVTLFFGSAAILTMVHALVKQLKLKTGLAQQIILAFYLLGTIFYGSFSRDDTWFWITVNPMYLWGTFAAVLGGSFIIQNEQKAILLYVLIPIAFLYVGGSSETVAIAVLTVLFYLGFITRNKNLSIRINRKALHLATVFCLIGFGIDLLGAGVNIRFHHLPQYSLTDRLLVGLVNYAKLCLVKIPMTLPAIVLGVSPLAFFGRKQLRFQLIALKELVIANRMLLAIADIVVIILAFALAFSMGELGPERAWIPLTFMSTIVALIFAYQLGTWLYIKLKGKLFTLIVVFQIVALFSQVLVGYNQVNVTTKYAQAVDERMKFIDSLPALDEIIELSPLPDSGWLFSAEIDSDTAHFRNRHLRMYFKNKAYFTVNQDMPVNQ